MKSGFFQRTGAKRSFWSPLSQLAGYGEIIEQRPTQEADCSVVNASTRRLVYWAACIDQRIAACSMSCERTLRRLMAVRRRLRAELELREGLILTLATPGSAPAPVLAKSVPRLARDRRLAAMFPDHGM